MSASLFSFVRSILPRRATRLGLAAVLALAGSTPAMASPGWWFIWSLPGFLNW